MVVSKIFGGRQRGLHDHLHPELLPITTCGRGTIRITVEPSGSSVIVSVSDNGEGIPRDQHKYVFEKFAQTNSGRQHRRSTGLGLAFCRLAVEAHQGGIGLGSEPEKEARFGLDYRAASSSERPGATVHGRRT